MTQTLTQAAALAFVANTMLEQARAMRRALGVLNAEPEDAPPKPRKRRALAGATVVKLHTAGTPASAA